VSLDLGAARSELLARISERRDEFIAAVLAHALSGLASGGSEGPSVLDFVARTAATSFDCGVGITTGDRRLSADEPEETIKAARCAARRGIPLDAVVHGYRVAHSLLWDVVAEEVAALGLESERRELMLRNASHAQFAYFDHLIGLVTREYEFDDEWSVRGAEQRLLGSLEALLTGHLSAADDLDYVLEAMHLALVLWGPAADATARRLVGGYPQPASLVVSPTSQLTWVWFATPDGTLDRQLQELHAGRGSDLFALSVGEPAYGPEGFRQTHEQARDGERIGRLTGARVVRFADIALEAAVLSSGRAPAFAATFLGDLLQPGARNAALRATLEAYLRTACNAASTAARLGVHDQSVRYRLRTIEHALGHSLEMRRAELDVALRLVRILDLADGACPDPATPVARVLSENVS
jgi:DNA-binding PucR family transcriptional regulator